MLKKINSHRVDFFIYYFELASLLLFGGYFRT